MRRLPIAISIFTVLFLVGISSVALAKQDKTSHAEVKLEQMFDKVPLAFEANEGQIDSPVQFISRGSGYGMFLSPRESLLVLSKGDGQLPEEIDEASNHYLSQSVFVHLALMGANPSPKLMGMEELPTKTHYLKGNDPKKWHTNIPSYGKVRYKEVYPGIDLMYYGNQQKLEYDFIVKPGADYKKIKLEVTGVDRMSIEEGNLIMHTSGGNIIQKAPIIYQEIDGDRKKIEGNYIFIAENQIGFDLGAYDTTFPLVIDPILEFSTYFGGNGSDTLSVFGRSMTVDENGNIYLTGVTSSIDFPVTQGAYDAILENSGGTNGSQNDFFVSKLSADGSSLIFSTYLGGSDQERYPSIAVDSNGNPYITGMTSSLDYPQTPGVFTDSRTSALKGHKLVITKIKADGSGLVYSTKFGSVGIPDIAVDENGNAYVVGDQNFRDFPTTPGAYDTTSNGSDVYVLKLDPTGSNLVFSTFLGGDTHTEKTPSLTLDDNNNILITGQTRSTDFPDQTPLFSPVLEFSFCKS